MGKKIPMWQTLLVMLAMVGFLMWSIIKDTGGEPHIALILAADRCWKHLQCSEGFPALPSYPVRCWMHA